MPNCFFPIYHCKIQFYNVFAPDYYNEINNICQQVRLTNKKEDSITFTIAVKRGYKLEWLRIDDFKDKNYDAANDYIFTAVEKKQHFSLKKIFMKS